MLNKLHKVEMLVKELLSERMTISILAIEQNKLTISGDRHMVEFLEPSSEGILEASMCDDKTTNQSNDGQDSSPGVASSSQCKKKPIAVKSQPCYISTIKKLELGIAKSNKETWHQHLVVIIRVSQGSSKYKQ